MGAYIVKCNEVVYNEDGSVKELRCTADLESGNGNPVDGRKIKGTIHWVSAKYAKDVTVKLYNRLFTLENMAEAETDENGHALYNNYLNPESLITVENAKVEPALDGCDVGEKFQFVRTGYFCKDSKYENTFNRIVPLKDSFKG
jgi:glutaminyl-tRNA synthetase